ncbi:hypothetical protein K3556_08160 [Aliiroseovarius sp. M344]|uniref:hypothetical protein n=1 Tax=Aliiroseovarius sp. M344 TaxID=2867010 RepID=UPI0021ADFF3C|nr:hypothetical protein [Aliiroseovarius sp. M344]UWQ12953.1 hypothetical protein K3556_08160 [Aliiroseovarius sp. M344]
MTHKTLEADVIVDIDKQSGATPGQVRKFWAMVERSDFSYVIRVKKPRGTSNHRDVTAILQHEKNGHIP